MQIPGHLALALALAHLPAFQTQKGLLKPLLLASLFPDLIDKAVGYIFHLMPNGRHYMHNVFSLIGLSLLVALVWGRAAGYAWWVGHLGHLLADSDSWLPWFFPLKKYDFKPGRLSFKRSELLRETILLVLVLLIRRLSH